MGKRISSMLLSLALVMSILPMSIASVAFAATAVPDGYTPIYDAEDLNAIRNDLDGNYALMNDIDLSSFGNWVPIGTSDNAFTGNFDGQGYTIRGLTVSTSSDYAGLFGFIRGDDNFIQNLNVVGSITSSGNDVGGIAGAGDAVQNCSFSGTVTGNGFVGGIVGSGYAMNCMNHGTVNGSNYVGGVVGYDMFGTKDCINTGTVTGGEYVGGIAGSGYVYRSYNTGDVTGNSDYIGGIAGDGCVFYCYNQGDVKGKENVGGIAGRSLQSHNDYNTGNVTGETSVGGIVGLAEDGIGGLMVFSCYNTGLVTGTESVGGIVGTAAGHIETDNCYYLQGTASAGVGVENGDLVKTVLEKSVTQFASGAVQQLLQGNQEDTIWVQTIGTDLYPLLWWQEQSQSPDIPGDEDASENINKYIQYATQFNGRNKSYFQRTFGVNWGAWCAYFITWCAQQCELSDVIPYTGATGTLFETMTNPSGSYGAQGVYFGNKTTGCLKYATRMSRADYIPQAGDLIFLVWSGRDATFSHVGLVIDYDSNSDIVYFVDGNAGNGIVKVRDGRTYSGFSRLNSQIVGYVRPNYENVTSATGTFTLNFRCPIEVNVSYNGERLSSSEAIYSFPYGTMACNDDESITVTLQYGLPYNISVIGTGDGTMELDVSYEIGTSKFEHHFLEVPITNQREISVISNKDSTVLVVCENGETVEAWISGNGKTVETKDNELLTDLLTPDVEPDNDSEMNDPNEPTIPSIPTIPNPAQTVNVSGSEGGTVTASPAQAGQGATVALTVTPDEGYELSALTVTDAEGNGVTTTKVNSGTYTFTMPGSAVTVRATFAEIQQEEPEPVPSFTDVPAGEYYYDAVLWAVANGITVGTGDNTFSPERTVTRAEMVTFLWRAAGCPEPETSANPFADISSEEYYYKAVLWAIENGITVGTGSGTFSPERTVTRAEAVTFQWRAAGAPAVSGGSFEDVSSGAYYASAVAWAVENGITQGTNSAGTQFSPETGVSRAQAVTFLYRQLG